MNRRAFRNRHVRTCVRACARACVFQTRRPGDSTMLCSDSAHSKRRSRKHRRKAAAAAVDSELVSASSSPAARATPLASAVSMDVAMTRFPSQLKRDVSRSRKVSRSNCCRSSPHSLRKFRSPSRMAIRVRTSTCPRRVPPGVRGTGHKDSVRHWSVRRVRLRLPI